ncbi:MAG: hypothetical protein M9887_05105 [Chitinophagales bacterium]|nr:hypothetical protein [Chitinophagales bacterium]
MKYLASLFLVAALLLQSNTSFAQKSEKVTRLKNKNFKFNAEMDSTLRNEKNLSKKILSDTINAVVAEKVSFNKRTPDEVQAPIIKYAKDSIESSLEYNAEDSIVYDIKNKEIYLYGNASVVYQDITVRGGKIIFNYDTQEVKALWGIDSVGNKKNKPEFSQAEEVFQADELRFNFKTKKGKSMGAVTKQNDSYLHSEEIKNVSDKVYFGKSIKYTSCEYDHPHFYIEISKAKIIKDKVIVGKPANLVVEDVRTPLFIPYGVFPILKERNTGLLMPEYGETDKLGFYLKGLGYYWSINDYLSTTITADIYSLGSWGINNNFDFNRKYRYSGNINTSFTSLQQSERRSSTFTKPSKEFFINSSFRLDPKRMYNGNFSASIYAGTQAYHQYNVSDAETFLNNTYRSSIAYQKWWPGKPFRLSVSANHSQNTQTKDITFQLPQFNFSVSRINPFQRKVATGGKKWYENIGFSYTMDMQNQINTKDSLLFKKETLDNMRNGIRHSIPVSGNFSLGKFLNLSTGMNYTERWYLSYNESIYHQTPDTFYVENAQKTGFKTVRDFGLNATLSTKLYGMLQFKKGKLMAIRHVVTPRLNFNYRPDFGKGHWGYYKDVQINPQGDIRQYSLYSNGIYGTAPQGKVGSVGFSVDNNIEIKVKSKKDTIKGEKKIPIIENLTFAGNYNFAVDSFQMSDISFSANNRISQYLALNVSGIFDPYVYDKDKNRRTPKLGIANGGKWLRLRTLSLNLSGSWQSKSRDGRQTVGDQFDPRNGLPNEDPMTVDGYYIQDQVFGGPLAYVDFNIPFSVNYNYSLSLNRFYSRGKDTASVTQTLGAGFNFSLTPKWKVSINSGFDFVSKKINRTDISVYRDLHCWQLVFNWVPLGFQKSFSLELNVKSQMLKDLKLAKRKMWVDYD